MLSAAQLQTWSRVGTSVSVGWLRAAPGGGWGLEDGRDVEAGASG